MLMMLFHVHIELMLQFLKLQNLLPSYAGLQLNLEIDALKKITSEIKKPITCIIGGSKISTKINIIKNLIPKFDNIIIVGGMANNILKYKGKLENL
jgi:phosphoglycerate kinase